jgi:acetyl-CoA acetyltransferase
VTDGPGAFVMTSAARARTLRKPPAYVLGAATCHDHLMISQMPELTTTPGVVSGAAAFAQAGVSADDVDVLMGYDSFTITALLHLEDLGFCAKGEGPAFVRSHDFTVAGSFPLNTSGGQLSVGRPAPRAGFSVLSKPSGN